MNVLKEMVCMIKDCFMKRQKTNLLQILMPVFGQVCYVCLESWKELEFTSRPWFHPWHLLVLRWAGCS